MHFDQWTQRGPRGFGLSTDELPGVVIPGAVIPGALNPRHGMAGNLLPGNVTFDGWGASAEYGRIRSAEVADPIIGTTVHGQVRFAADRASS